MDDSFDLNVTFGKTDRAFKTVFQQWGFSYRFIVEVDGQEIFFEPDEEKNFRAVIRPENQQSVNVELIKAIAQTLEETLKT